MLSIQRLNYHSLLPSPISLGLRCVYSSVRKAIVVWWLVAILVPAPSNQSTAQNTINPQPKAPLSHVNQDVPIRSHPLPLRTRRPPPHQALPLRPQRPQSRVLRPLANQARMDQCQSNLPAMRPASHDASCSAGSAASMKFSHPPRPRARS